MRLMRREKANEYIEQAHLAYKYKTTEKLQSMLGCSLVCFSKKSLNYYDNQGLALLKASAYKTLNL